MKQRLSGHRLGSPRMLPMGTTVVDKLEQLSLNSRGFHRHDPFETYREQDL